MSIELGAAYISILPSTDKLASGIKSELGDAEKQSKVTGKRMGQNLGSSISGGMKKAFIGIGGVIAAAGVGNFLKDTVAAGRESIKIGKQTDAVIKSMGATSWTSSKQIGDMVTALSNKTAVDDEAIQSGANLLLTFGNLRNEAGKGNNVFDQTVALANDMSVAMGQDMKSSSIMLGKALNNPTKGLSALARVGVSFSESQSEQIKKMQESGDMLGAQKAIMAEVEKQFGGSAEAVATPMDKLRVTLGNLQEEFGMKLIPIIDKAAAYIGKNLPHWLDVAGAAFDKVRNIVNDYFLPVFESVFGFIKNNVSTVKAFAIVLGVGAVAVGIVTAAVAAFNAVLAVNPITLVIVALAALAAALVYAYTKSETFRKIVDTAWAGIKKAISIAWSVIKPVLTAYAYYIKNVLWPVIKGLYTKVVKPVFAAMKKVIGVYIKIYIAYFKALWSFLKNVIFPIFKAWWNNVVKPVMTGIGRVISAAWNNVIKPVFKALGSFINDTVVPAFRKGMDKIEDIWNGLKSAARKPVEFLVNTVYNNGIRAMMNKIPGVDLPYASFATGGWTGPGAKYQAAGIVHADEYVVSKEARRSIERQSPGLLDYMNNYGSLPGYAKGGVVNPLAGSHWGTYEGHDGVDLNVGSGWDDYGMPIRAFRAGTISYVGTGRGYGQAVFERGPWGEVVYGHMSRYATSAGANVSAGQVIGYVGSTGNSSAPHLHFGIPGGTTSQALALLAGATNIFGGAAVNPGEEKKQGFLDAIKSIPSMAKSVWSNITGMGSKFGPWGEQFKQAGIATIRSAIEYGDNKIPNKIEVPKFPDIPMPDNPIRDSLKALGIFDNGGVLEPGMLAYNASKKPEAVFNQQQFKKFAEGGGRGSGFPEKVILDVDGEQFEAYVRRNARDEVYAENSYNNNRRGAYV